MKFGETLAQRSVTQWRNYNIDYAQIKRFIKENTTSGKGKAVSIPGRGDELGIQVEDDLFYLLQTECNRISLFVRSKRYELDSRLGSIERQLDLASRRTISTNNPQKALHLRQRFSKIENDVLAVGEEIQKISRFTSINKTAVRKLLKKHRKWSRNTSLAPRVETEVLSQPDCFSRTQLQSRLDRYTEFLERVRSPFAGAVSPKTALYSASTQPKQDACSFGSWDQFQGSKRDFDTAIEDQSHHTFWIHPDNVTELTVLLLQHLRSSRRGSASCATSNTLSANQDMITRSSVDEADRTATLLLDDEARLVNSTTQASERCDPNHFWRPLQCLSWYINGDEHDQLELKPYEVKPQRPGGCGVRSLAAEIMRITRKNGSDSSTGADALDSYDAIWKLLQSFVSRRPVAQTNHLRTRYMGLRDPDGSGSWAILDEDVHFSRLLSEDDLSDSSSTSVLDRIPRTNPQIFPYAILTVAASGTPGAALNSTLQNSHLTEAVDGFDIRSHVLASLYQNETVPTPTWFPLLGNDIRHIPSHVDNRKKQGSSRDQHSSTSSTLQGTPRSGPKSAGTPMSAHFAFPHTERQETRKQSPEAGEQPTKPYWNEYDNPESEMGDDFAVYVDPDAPLFPGQVTLKRWYQSLKDKVSPNCRGVRGRDLESSHSPSTRSVSSTSSDDEADDELSGFHHPGRKPLLANRKPDYGSLARYRTDIEQEHDYLAFLTTPQTSTLCLLASVLILVISAFLAFTSRKKLRGEVDVAAAIGIIASVCFMGVAAIRWWTAELPARGNLINNLEASQRTRTPRDWLRSATRRIGDVIRVVAMVLVTLGSILLLIVVFK